MKSPLRAAIVLAFAGLISLFGCAGTQDDNPSDSVESSPETIQEGAPLSITVKVPTLSMETVVDPEITSAAQFLTKAAADFVAQYDGNVEVNVVEFEIAEETAAVADTFGTEAAPDVLFEGYFNMGTYIHDGVVVPLDDIISPELRADIPDSFWELSQVNGKTYMMPFLHVQNTLSFNPGLFAEAGLEEYLSDDSSVQTWTPEQWDEVLTTLRESLPDTAYPMMMYAADDQGDTHIMTLLRSKGCSFYDEEGHFAINTPEGIAALQWIKDSYDEGYFPTGADTLVILDNYSLFLQGMLALYVNNASQDYSVQVDGGFAPLSVNFPSPEGGLATTFVTGFEVMDNGDADRLALALDFVRYIYESDYLDYSAGGIPVCNSVAEKYAEELAPLKKYIDNDEANWSFTGNHPNWRGVRAVFYRHIQDLLFGAVTPEECAAALDADCNAAIEAGYAESVVHE